MNARHLFLKLYNKHELHHLDFIVNLKNMYLFIIEMNERFWFSKKQDDKINNKNCLFVWKKIFAYF